MELPRCMKICGRFVWLILQWAQLGVFCFYVHLCWDFSVLASIVFSWFFVNCILRLVLGPVILLFSKRKLHYDPYIWLGYTVLFIVDFVLVFTLVEDRPNEERSPRPVISKPYCVSHHFFFFYCWTRLTTKTSNASETSNGCVPLWRYKYSTPSRWSTS